MASRNANQNETTPLQGRNFSPNSPLMNPNEIQAKLADVERTLSALRGAVGTVRGGRSGRGGKEKLGRLVTSRLLFLTVMWQVLNVGLLTLLDMYTPKSVFNPMNDYFTLGIVLMVVCQFMHLIIMVAATVKLAKQLLHHTATSGFLLQSYLSTIVLYAGIYTLLHRYQPDVWSGSQLQGKITSDDYVIKSFVVFIYYSTATITSTGYGDVYPNSWYLYLLVSTEMLLGVLYQVCCVWLLEFVPLCQCCHLAVLQFTTVVGVLHGCECVDRL
eukprot:m.93246 g.93246  ORF g.93246 m.93246 type:complete len:272 (+) comp9991_c0_seq3:284-1099(+)